MMEVQVRLTFSFFTVKILVLARMHLQSNFVENKLWYTSLPMNIVGHMFWFPCM
jgi:hypothetical protein